MRGNFIQNLTANEIPSLVIDRLRAGEEIMDTYCDEHHNVHPVIVVWDVDADGVEKFVVYERGGNKFTWSYGGGRFQVHKLAGHASGQNSLGEVIGCVDLIDGRYVIGLPYDGRHRQLTGMQFETMEEVVAAFEDAQYWLPNWSLPVEDRKFHHVYVRGRKHYCIESPSFSEDQALVGLGWIKVSDHAVSRFAGAHLAANYYSAFVPASAAEAFAPVSVAEQMVAASL